MAVMNDGHQTTITFTSSLLTSASILTLVMKEKEVTPPGVSAGGANDVTTMRNETWRSMAPKNLKTLTESPIVVAWAPGLYTEMNNMIGDNQEITMTFPDDATLVYWGFIDSFNPNAHVEGTQPTANVSIIPTNMDANNDDAEIAPVLTE